MFILYHLNFNGYRCLFETKIFFREKFGFFFHFENNYIEVTRQDNNDE